MNAIADLLQEGDLTIWGVCALLLILYYCHRTR